MFFLILPYGSCPICINRHFRVIRLDYQPLAVRENEQRQVHSEVHLKEKDHFSEKAPTKIK